MTWYLIRLIADNVFEMLGREFVLMETDNGGPITNHGIWEMYSNQKVK